MFLKEKSLFFTAVKLQTRWTEHQDATAQADESDQSKEPEWPVVEASLSGCPVEGLSAWRHPLPAQLEWQKAGSAKTQPAPNFVTKYHPGNVREFELFSIDPIHGCRIIKESRCLFTIPSR